ncbi:MAG: hypothetical protein LBQ23_04230, partial [Puniceicoccales bacterium]|nr:hypothetical protein [Puniceicoccales bacterium]
MKATPQVNGPLDLLSGTGTNSSISSLDPTVVDILKNDFGFKLNGKSLDTRSADASGSQGRESDEVSSIDVFEPAQESAFQSFIGGAKHEMGFLDRCLILLKAIISGDYGFEVAKQILGKLIQIGRANQTSDNPGFLKAAFGAIALPENKDNVAHNIKHLLRLSKGKIQTRDIIDEFKKIGNVDSRIEFLGKLKEKLSEKEKTEFKDFLTETLDGIADQIADEFNNSQSIDKNALLSKLKSVDLLKTALLAKVKVGVPSLVRLVNDNKLKVSELSIDNAIAVANALLECGVNGLDRLAELINGNKLPDFISGHNSSARKRIACDLLSRG